MPILLPNEEVSHHDLHGYIIFLFAHDHPYPPHVHIRKPGRRSGWNLQTLTCTHKGGFSSSEIRDQHKILVKYKAQLW